MIASHTVGEETLFANLITCSSLRETSTKPRDSQRVHFNGSRSNNQLTHAHQPVFTQIFAQNSWDFRPYRQGRQIPTAFPRVRSSLFFDPKSVELRWLPHSAL